MSTEFLDMEGHLHSVISSGHTSAINYESNQLPCQIEDRKDREKTIESQLEYSADKLFQTQADEKKFDEGFFKRELRDMQERCLENQRTMQRIENKYFRSSTHQQSDISHTSSQFQPEEKMNTDLSQMPPPDSKYNLECEVSVIKKNTSINQDLSLLERVGDEDKNADLEMKVHVLMSENLRLSKVNSSLFQEVEHYKDGRNSGHARSDSRELQLRNTQITDLQRRVFEAERGQVEKQSEDFVQSQCLERKVHQLGEQNSILVRQVERYKQELHQSQSQLHELSEHNAQLEDDRQLDNDREEYQRLKIEFEEFQRLTQNIINQEEECQRRICEQDEELCQQAILQEDLVNRLSEADGVYQQKMYDMKQSFQNEFEAAIRRMQEQNQNLREQNQYLFDQLQSYELEKQNIEEYFLNEIECIKEQCAQKCEQLLKTHEKQLHDKNSLICQLQEQQPHQQEQCSQQGTRSKSLSACNGINKLAGLLQPNPNKTNQNYYLPPYRANISLEEDQYGRMKQNNSYHNSSTHATQNLNTSLTYKKKALAQQIYNKQQQQQQSSSKQSVEKENMREWEKSALMLSQKKQKDQYFREQYSKQKTNLQLRQLDGDFKFSPQVQGLESRINHIVSHQNSTTNNNSSNNSSNYNSRYANIYKYQQQQDSRVSLSNGPRNKK